MAVMEKSIGENSLEITRNPFDSGDLDRENLPGLSPSVFRRSITGSAEKTNFRWSIDQLALLKPAEIDEFPLQEYSSIYSREEEESEVQKAIDEYFSTVTLPSPWLEQKDAVRSKRVTFSPLPPTTVYIMDESYESEEAVTQQNKGKVQVADASCQTKLTFPIHLDLERLLAKFLLNPPGSVPNKEDSSFVPFRRKLFTADDSTPTSSEALGDGSDVVFQSPRREVADMQSPGLITSSPLGPSPKYDDHSEEDVIRRSSMIKEPLCSPAMSPLTDLSSNQNNSKQLSDSEPGLPHAQLNSNSEIIYNSETSKSSDNFTTGSNYGHSCPYDGSSSKSEGLSLEFSVEHTWNNKIIESTRVTDLDINSMSPIKLSPSGEETMNLSVSRNQSLDAMEMSCLQDESVKESTARQFHGITYLGLSPIQDISSENEEEEEESVNKENWNPMNISSNVQHFCSPVLYPRAIHKGRTEESGTKKSQPRRVLLLSPVDRRKASGKEQSETPTQAKHFSKSYFLSDGRQHGISSRGYHY